MRYFSITEAAKRLGTSSAGVGRLVSDGKLRAYRRWYGARCFARLDVLQLQRRALPVINSSPSNLDFTGLADLDFTK